jgi:putative alpha-1,2-mannosidase
MLRSRLGVSFVSASRACQFIEEELPTWDLEPVVTAAEEQWNI